MKEDEKTPPKWISHFFKVVYNHWQHHSPCEHINFQTMWNPETKCWHISASPVFQEVWGGVDDGKEIWAGFVFEFGRFSRSDGIWIQESAIMSVCNECNPLPKHLIKGKFKGHPFYLHIYLEPQKNSDAVEIVDTIKHEIRVKEGDSAT